MMHSNIALSESPGLLADSIYEVINKQRYGVEYQPIICTRSGDILAYEALARFYTAEGDTIAPMVVFEELHHDLHTLNQVEFSLKSMQINHAPEDYDLFINIDPHAIIKNDHLDECPLFKQLHSKNNIVVELIENSDIHEAYAAIELHKFLQSKNIKTALDDIGADHALLSLEILSLVNYLKFDRSWLKKVEQPRYASLFSVLLEYATQMNRLTVLEGIENQSMLGIAHHYGIDRVQGFLYRPLFQSVKP